MDTMDTTLHYGYDYGHDYGHDYGQYGHDSNSGFETVPSQLPVPVSTWFPLDAVADARNPASAAVASSSFSDLKRKREPVAQLGYDSQQCPTTSWNFLPTWPPATLQTTCSTTQLAFGALDTMPVSSQITLLPVQSELSSPQDLPLTLRLEPDPPQAELNLLREFSIRGVLCEHNRTRLYVRPLFWTAKHLEVLDIKLLRTKLHKSALTPIFPETPPKPAMDLPHGDEVEGPWTAAETAQYAGTNLVHCRYLKPFWIKCLTELLGVFNICPTSSCGDRLSFRFGQQTVSSLRVDAIYSHRCFSPDAPSIVVLDLNTLQEHRKNTIRRPDPGGRCNSPCAVIQWKKLRNIEPEKELEDPYIVAILIALAQEQRRVLDRRRDAAIKASRIPSFSEEPDASLDGIYESGVRGPRKKFEVFAILHSKQGLFVYRSQISAAYLDRFDKPSETIRAKPVVISYRHIPMLPSERLVSGMKSALFPYKNKLRDKAK
ncbi:hypothetical protein G7046_g8031 [Stylonectria norvegica]|nr:hypothetical protein G7046_g8031 [Stylonectria norvegica]